MDELGLTQLGRRTDGFANPDAAVLERVANPQKGQGFIARFTAPEFTSLCPVTGQPDFARLVIDYAPGDWLIESKSLKLYLASFRNHGAFHEDCTLRIGRKIVATAEPVWLRIGGYWYPRGGIPIDVFWQSGPPPEDLWLPEQGVAPYAGRYAQDERHFAQRTGRRAVLPFQPNCPLRPGARMWRNWQTHWI